MCNACGFYCCGSDQFERCGCESCPYSECWPDEPDDTYDDDYPDDYERSGRFRCVEIRDPEGSGSPAQPRRHT